MKQLRYLTLAVLLSVSAFATVATAKTVVVPKMYMFGFAASFNDSIVHFTEIQAVDSVWIDAKTKFMAGRENYSYQLRDYLAERVQMPHRTCVVFYNQDRQKLEKEYLKMKRIYTTGKKKEKKKDKNTRKSNNDLRILSSSDFLFHTINMGVETED